MKKMLLPVLALILMLTLTACGDERSSKNDDADETDAPLYAATVSFTAGSEYDLQTCVDLMKDDAYYELIAEASDRDLTASDVEDILSFSVEDGTLNVTVTAEGARDVNAVLHTVYETTSSYIQNVNADITLTASGVSDVEKVD